MHGRKLQSVDPLNLWLDALSQIGSCVLEVLFQHCNDQRVEKNKNKSCYCQLSLHEFSVLRKLSVVSLAVSHLIKNHFTQVV
jgi:hypothetical protein